MEDLKKLHERLGQGTTHYGWVHSGTCAFCNRSMKEWKTGDQCPVRQKMCSEKLQREFK